MHTRARVALIAASSTLMAACFRFVPATNPGLDVLDSAAQDGTDARSDTAPTDIVTMDTPDDAIFIDATDATTPDTTVTDTGVVDDRPDASEPADVRTDTGTTDSCVAPPSGSDAGVAAGNCAMNNGGCSSFAQCRQFCGGMRQCVCASGLALGADGASCTGLILVSKTSIDTTGSNFNTSSYEPYVTRTGRSVAFISVVETTLRTPRCFALNVATNALTEIGATRDAMGAVQRPEACGSPTITEDGTRALFIARGIHPGDREAPPAWPASVLSTTVWPYYRDSGGAPTRVNVWQHVPFMNIHPEGFNNFRFSRDGQRMAFSTRSQVDPMLVPGDNMDFYSASIPIRTEEPLYENVTVNRTIAPFFAGISNSRDLDLCGDSTTLIFGTARRPTGDTHPGTDIFVRRIGATGAGTPTLYASPDSGGSGDSRWPTASNDGSVTCFVTTSPTFGVASSGEYVLSVRSGTTYTVHRLSIPVPPSGALANSLSDDGTRLVVATNAAFTIAGQPMDSNGATDYYLFDVSNPAMPRAMARMNLTQTNEQPMLSLMGIVQARIAGDGNSVAFVTSQQLLAEDNNGGGSDIYLRVLR